MGEGLQRNRQLRWLGLGQNSLGPDGAWELCVALQNNPVLLWLGIGANELGDKGAEYICDLLQSIIMIS